MRITDIIKELGHPRKQAKLIIPKINLVTGVFSKSDWLDLDKKVVKTLYLKYSDNNKKLVHSIWMRALFKELHSNYLTTWNKFYYFAQTPELLVVPKLHFAAAYYSNWCPVCDCQWVASTQAWGCYDCVLKNPALRANAKTIKSKATTFLNTGGKYTHCMHNPKVVLKVRNSKIKSGNIESAAHVLAKTKATYLANPSIEIERVIKVKANWKAKTQESIKVINNKRHSTIALIPSFAKNKKLKMQQSWLEKSTGEIEVINDKRSNTYFANTGYYWPSQNPTMLALREQSYLEHYGETSPSKVFAVKEKKKLTNQLRRGVDYSLQCPLIKQQIINTNQIKYGSSYAMQNPSVAIKAISNAYNLYDVNIENVNFKVQASYEKEILPILCKEYGVTQVQSQFSNGYKPTEKWTPDFYIIKENKYIEIKSSWTLCKDEKTEFKNREKARTTVNCEWRVKQHEVWVTLPKLWYLHPNLYALLNGLWLRALGYDVIINKQKIVSNGLMFLNHEIAKSFRSIHSFIEAKNNIYSVSIGARQTEVKRVSTEDASTFLKNHVQGYTNAKYNIGLYYNDILVALATFRKPISTKGYDWELARFCIRPKWQVKGGASKLMSAFIKIVGSCSILTYADKRYSEGKVYKAIGFTLLRESKPGYFWVRGAEVLSRYKTQKHKLLNLLGKDFNSSLSESVNMKSLGWVKVYDLGQYVFARNYVI